MVKEFSRAKYGCYISNMSLAIATGLPPVLFMTFREMYGISYTLLGLLAVANFTTQLIVDLVFSFLSKHFNIHKTLRITPAITCVGLLVYAILPSAFPHNAFLGLFVGTILFSISAGLNEVLISPTIAAIPSDNPEREMSKLHSMFAYGSLSVVVISTLFIFFFGASNWKWLVVLWAFVPMIAFLVLSRAVLPPMSGGIDENSSKDKISAGLILCIACIFLGGASECTMGQWASGFIEGAIGIPKIWGDMFGTALFSLFLLIGREMHAKYNFDTVRIMFCGMIGAVMCYVIASFSLNPIIGLIACMLTGFFTANLWPGMIIVVGEKFPGAGVAVYALMAAGGDLGASVGPQLVGIVSDKFALSSSAFSLSNILNITTEQVGLRAGLLSAALFPLAGVVLIICLKKYFNKLGGR